MSIFKQAADALTRLDSIWTGSPTDPLRPASDSGGGWRNPFTGMGLPATDPAQSTAFTALQPLTEQQATDLFRGSALARRVVSVPAADATREGFDVVWDGQDVDALIALIDKIPTHKEGARGVDEALRRWLEWWRLYGGAVIVLICADSEDTALPLDEANPRLQELRVKSRFEIEAPQWGDLNLWREVGSGRVWHRSRLIPIGRSTLPGSQSLLYQGWEDSVLGLLRMELAAVATANASALQALTLQGLAVRKISGLAQILSRGGAELTARMGLESLMRGAFRTVLLDAEKEDYGFAAPALSALPELFDRFPRALASASGIPPFKLLGTETGGLSTEDLTAERAYLASVKGEIVTPHLAPASQRICTLLARTLSPSAPAPVVTPRPLWTPTAEEAAAASKAQVDAVVALVGAGVVAPEQVRAWSEGGVICVEIEEPAAPPPSA